MYHKHYKKLGWHFFRTF